MWPNGRLRLEFVPRLVAMRRAHPDGRAIVAGMGGSRLDQWRLHSKSGSEVVCHHIKG